MLLMVRRDAVVGSLLGRLGARDAAARVVRGRVELEVGGAGGASGGGLGWAAAVGGLGGVVV